MWIKTCLLGLVPLALLLSASPAIAQSRQSDRILRTLDDVDDGPSLRASQPARRTALVRTTIEPEGLPPVEGEPLPRTSRMTGRDYVSRDHGHNYFGDDYGCDSCGGGGCDDCCDDCCEPCCLKWGGDVFGVVDGWRSRIDDDHSNNFGTRVGANVAMPIGCAWSGQVGASYGVYDFHGRERANTNAAEQQVFLTGGVFRTADLSSCCWYDAFNVGVVYDHMNSDNAGDTAADLRLGQIRVHIGYVWDDCNEFGVFGSAASTDWDELAVDNRGAILRTRAMQQANFFWRHVWCSGADTMVYVGCAEDPGEMTFGFRGELPLNDCLWVVAGAHYILPSTSGGAIPINSYAEESWNVFVGLSYRIGYPRSCGVVPNAWTPLMPVADNGSFALEARPGNF